MIYEVNITRRYDIDYELIIQDFAADLKQDGWDGVDTPEARKDNIRIAWDSGVREPYFRLIDEDEEGFSVQS